MHRFLRTSTGRLVPLGFLCLLVLAVGCSSYASVKGKVTYQGKALTGGTVLFTSPGKGSQTAIIGEDGSYSIDKIAAGPVKIAVETQSVQPPITGFTKGGPPKSMEPPKGVTPPGAANPVYGSGGKKRTAVKIPENYADPDKSGLTYTVKTGAQDHPIDLK
jgi:hypothetical protein